MAMQSTDANLIEYRDDLLKHICNDEGRLANSIQLGDIDESYKPLILNKKNNLDMAAKTSSRNKSLQMHGIKIAKNKADIITEYLVTVFLTDTPLIYKSNTRTIWLRNNTLIPEFRVLNAVEMKNKETQRIQRLAIQTIYSLGLDYGIVKCGIGSGGKAYVLNIKTDAKLNTQMLEAFKQALGNYLQELELANTPPFDEVVLGADLEFVMKSPEGELILASDHFDVHGKVGCDNASLGVGKRNKKPVAELRPDPIDCPLKLSDEIYFCMNKAAEIMSDTDVCFLSGAMPLDNFPIGGHIHFSGVAPEFRLLRALDNYLALPLILIEDPRGSHRRPKYGFLGDFRYQPHGGFEYRTLPSWLFSPELAQGVLSLAKIIATNYKEFRYAPLDNKHMQEAYYRGDKSMIRVWLDALWEDIVMCKEYSKYYKPVSSLYKRLRSERSWDESKDIFINWKEYYDEQENI